MSATIPNLVTTIIPVYNRAIFFVEAVRSALAQTYRPIEIILVDDGSTDSTPALMAELCSAHPAEITCIRIENQGPGGAREAGRLVARGQYIQYLDSDDRLLPNKFQIQVQALQEHSECGIAYGRTRLIDAGGNVLKSPYKRSGIEQQQLFPHLLVDRWWNTHTPLYRRTLCDRLGQWTTMRMGEDWEYDARAAGLKTRLVYCDADVSEHRQHDEGRLTGKSSLTDANLRDTADLIVSLWKNARKAGVPLECPEMQHFSRWSFSIARQLALRCERLQAESCFQVAKQSVARGARRLAYRGTEILRRTLGWRKTAVVLENGYRLHRTIRGAGMKRPGGEP